jgi:tetratricopeptide (TPR) repeat protein
LFFQLKKRNDKVVAMKYSRGFSAFIFFLVIRISAACAGQSHTASEMAERGSQELKDGRFREAKTLLERALHLDPSQPSYHAALAEVDWNLQDAPGAIHNFEIAVRLNPSDEAVRTRLAQLYQLLGRDSDVLRILRAPSARDPLVRSIWRFSRGFSLFRIGRLSAARHEFETVVNHPDFQAAANFFLGRIAYTQNRFEEALPFFANAVRLGDSPTNKEFSSYTYDYGLTLFKLGRYSEANEQFTLSTERYALEPLAWMMRGRCDEELKNYQAAIKDYEQSIKVDPKFELSYYHLARLQQRYGDKERAEELFKHLGDLRESDIKEAQTRAEQQAILRTKRSPSGNYPAAVPKP